MVFQCGDCKYWRPVNIWDSKDCGRCDFNDEEFRYKAGSICEKFEPSHRFYSELYSLMVKAEEICGGNDYED